MTDPRTNHINPGIDDDRLDDAFDLENVTTQDLVSTWRQDVSLADRKLAVQKAIQALPADQRRLIVLRFFEESELKECAEIMGIPIGEAMIMYRSACLELTRLLK